MKYVLMVLLVPGCMSVRKHAELNRQLRDCELEHLRTLSKLSKCQIENRVLQDSIRVLNEEIKENKYE